MNAHFCPECSGVIVIFIEAHKKVKERRSRCEKTTVRIFVCVLFICLGCLQSYALAGMPIDDCENNERYANSYGGNVVLEISNTGIAKATARAKGIKGETVKISVSMQLERLTKGAWVKIQTWSGSTNSINLLLTKQKNVSKGKYRVCAKFKVYRKEKIAQIAITS